MTGVHPRRSVRDVTPISKVLLPLGPVKARKVEEDLRLFFAAGLDNRFQAAQFKEEELFREGEVFLQQAVALE